MRLHDRIHAEKDRKMRYTEYERKLLSLLTIRRIQTGKLWLSVGRWHAYVSILKHTVGNGRGKLYATGCEGPTIGVS
jgi:hypothetical protein